jgi:hypothetical protein
VIGTFIIITSTLKFYELASGKDIPGLAGKMLDYTSQYSIVNNYHVFPTMTTERIELEILGSRDGMEWRPIASATNRICSMHDRIHHAAPAAPRLADVVRHTAPALTTLVREFPAGVAGQLTGRQIFAGERPVSGCCATLHPRCCISL